jgi:ribokinase
MVQPRIIVVGSCNTDMVIKADRLPAPGETVLGGTFLMNPGGKGANQAVAAARMGGVVTLVSKIGNDLFGKQLLNLFQSENIYTGFVFSDPDLPSGVALITVDAKGENCIVVASGANSSLSPLDVDIARGELVSNSLVLMQLEIPLETVDYVASIAHEKHIRVILNPAPAKELPEALLKKVDIIVPNQSEAEFLTGIPVTDLESARVAASAIQAKGVGTVIITMGAKGALVLEKDVFQFIKAQQVEAVDTTAAGDVFCGAFCVGLSEGNSVHDAVRLASQAAAISVTRMGAQASAPYRSELI